MVRTFPVNHLYVCYRRHIHTLLCRTLSPTCRLISFLVYFLVCERCRTFYLYGSMWLFSSHEFYKKNRKKSGWRRSSRRQTFFLFEFVSQQHNEYTRRHGAVARRTRGRGGRWPWCRSDRRRNRSERPSLGVERNFVGVVFVLRRERSARDFR